MKIKKYIRLIGLNIFLLINFLVLTEICYRIYVPFKNKSINFMSFYSSLLNLNGSEMNDNYKRVPYPYVMFKGKENIYDHNSIGYKFNENLPADNFRIAESSPTSILLNSGPFGDSANSIVIEDLSALNR